MYANRMICIYGLKIPYTSGFNKIAKNQILIKYTEFKYGIYKNVYKPYINCIISVYIFLIGYPYNLHNPTALHLMIFHSCNVYYYY